LNARFRFKAAGDTQPNLELLEAADPLVLRLSGLRITDIKNISHAPIEYTHPYEMKIGNPSEICEVFDKIFDPCALTPFWTRKHGADDFKQEGIQTCNQKYLDHMRAHWN
jgi:hypothetical protein